MSPTARERKRLEELRRKERRQHEASRMIAACESRKSGLLDRLCEVSKFSKRLHDVEFIQKTRAARRIQASLQSPGHTVPDLCWSDRIS